MSPPTHQNTIKPHSNSDSDDSEITILARTDSGYKSTSPTSDMPSPLAPRPRRRANPPSLAARLSTYYEIDAAARNRRSGAAKRPPSGLWIGASVGRGAAFQRDGGRMRVESVVEEDVVDVYRGYAALGPYAAEDVLARDFGDRAGAGSGVPAGEDGPAEGRERERGRLQSEEDEAAMSDGSEDSVVIGERLRIRLGPLLRLKRNRGVGW